MRVEPGMMGQTVPLGAGLQGSPRPGWLDQGGPAGADGEVARPGQAECGALWRSQQRHLEVCLKSCCLSLTLGLSQRS